MSSVIVIFVINYQLQGPCCASDFGTCLVESEDSCVEKGADCCPRALKTLRTLFSLSKSKHVDKISQIVPVIEKVTVIVMITILGKPFN